MSGADPELGPFLDAVRKLLQDHVTPGRSLDGDALPGLRRALDDADITGLAFETAGMDDALRWLSAVVTEVAKASPSLAYVLSARYTAHRAVLNHTGRPDGGAEATSALVDPAPGVASEDGAGAEATVPALFDPSTVLTLDASDGSGVLASHGSVTDLGDAPARTGLADAGLRLVRVSGPAVQRLDVAHAAAALRDWHILTTSVSTGIADAALSAAETYATDRRQFGARLTSFAGLRAILAEMRVRLSAATALLDQALAADDDAVTPAVASATAGRAAVDIACHAIQVHGGYGYIEEYPVARLLRDAISVRARGGSRRGLLARVAEDRLGPPEQVTGR